MKLILIKCRLLSFVQPIYEALISLLPNICHQREKEYRERQEKMLKFYSQFIKKGDAVFDIGAHRGNRTEIFLRLGARVVAVEPQKRCIKYLQSKFGKEPNFILVKKGLSDKEGKLTIFVCGEADTISTFSEKWKTGRFSNYKWNKQEIVPVTTLDNLIKEFGIPSFCKIDVEGYELKVLKGLSKPIPYLSFEFTKEFFEDAKACLDHLISLGYWQFNFSLSGSMEFFFPRWESSKEIIQKTSLIKDKLLWGDIYAKFF